MFSSPCSPSSGFSHHLPDQKSAFPAGAENRERIWSRAGQNSPKGLWQREHPPEPALGSCPTMCPCSRPREQRLLSQANAGSGWHVPAWGGTGTQGGGAEPRGCTRRFPRVCSSCLLDISPQLLGGMAFLLGPVGCPRLALAQGRLAGTRQRWLGDTRRLLGHSRCVHCRCLGGGTSEDWIN